MKSDIGRGYKHTIFYTKCGILTILGQATPSFRNIEAEMCNLYRRTRRPGRVYGEVRCGADFDVRLSYEYDVGRRGERREERCGAMQCDAMRCGTGRLQVARCGAAR